MKDKLITVQGRGRLSIEPDTAVIKCQVSALNRSYADANRDMNRRVELLRRVLPALGFAKGDLKTTDFTVTRENRRNPETEEYEFAGYNAGHSLELRLPLDKERLNQVMEVMLGSKANALLDVSFTLADPEPVRSRLLTAAVENARQRAEIITLAAGAKLGKIANISYGVTEVRFRSEPDICLGEASGPDAPEIEPGDFLVEDSVTITWEIAD